MFSSKRITMRVWGVAFLVLAMCFSFALGLSACTTADDGDDDGGGTAATETTVMETTTTEEVTTTTVPEGIDPSLIGTWYSDYMEETLTYTADGTLVVSWDGGDNSESFAYTAENGTTIDGAGNRVAYSISGDELTIQDSEEGTQVYVRVSE